MLKIWVSNMKWIEVSDDGYNQTNFSNGVGELLLLLPLDDEPDDRNEQDGVMILLA